MKGRDERRADSETGPWFFWKMGEGKRGRKRKREEKREGMMD